MITKFFNFRNLILFVLTTNTNQTALPSFVQSIINLANDATTWLLAISIVLAAVMGIYRGIQWYTADDNEKAPAAKRVKTVIIGAVLVVGFEGILKLVLSYF